MKTDIKKVMARAGLIVSMSQGRRVIIQGAVKLNGEPVDDIGNEVEMSPGDKLQFGKKEVTITEKMLGVE